MKTIYNIELHEALQCEPKYGVFTLEVIEVLRVAGGWIYTTKNRPSVFVPYNKEFAEQENDKVYREMKEENRKEVAQYECKSIVNGEVGKVENCTCGKCQDVLEHDQEMLKEGLQRSDRDTRRGV